MLVLGSAYFCLRSSLPFDLSSPGLGNLPMEIPHLGLTTLRDNPIFILFSFLLLIMFWIWMDYLIPVVKSCYFGNLNRKLNQICPLDDFLESSS